MTRTPKVASDRSQGKCKNCGQLSLIPPHLGLIRSMDLGWLCSDCTHELLRKCSFCGTARTLNKLTLRKQPQNPDDDSQPEDLHLCPTCNASAGVCQTCGTIFPNKPDERPRYVSGSPTLCPDCLKKQFFLCPDCGRWERNSSGMTVTQADGSEKKICRACIQTQYNNEDIFHCSHCDNWYVKSLLSREPGFEHHTLCQSCAARVAPCDECHNLVEREELSEEHLCRRCLMRQFGMRSYNYSPSTLKFKSRPGETPATDPYLGLELEVDLKATPNRNLDANASAAAITKAIGTDHVYCKSDGSLCNGVEQVTHPATLRYYQFERERYEKLCTIPKQLGYRSHDSGSCGLHVHVGRKFFENKQSEAISRVIWLVERFWVEMFKFSRREGSDIASWASRYLGPQAARNPAAVKKESLLQTAMTASRYRAVNLQRPATIEFRLFRGTLNVETFWATLQLVDNLVRLAKQTDDEQMLKITWQDIVEFTQYPELMNYSARRVGTKPLPLQSVVTVPDITDDGWKETFRKLCVPQMPDLEQPVIVATPMCLVRLSEPRTFDWFQRNLTHIISRGPIWVFAEQDVAYHKTAGLLHEDRVQYTGGYTCSSLEVVNLLHTRHRQVVNSPVLIVPPAWLPDKVKSWCETATFEILGPAVEAEE